ncbi:MAG: glycosyltransferase family 2 protein [bacterium]
MIMSALTWGLALSGLALAIPALYLLILTVAALRHPGRRQIDGVFHGLREARQRFIILIPAHNEELLLGTVVQQLDKLSYPRSHFEIVVIADNCDDRTAAVARAADAEVLERHDLSQRGKGHALDWALRGALAQWARPYDAVVVLDADSVVNADFLWFMQARLETGAEALQSYYGVLNPLENWRTSLSLAALAAFHFLRPLGRDRLGLPCGLKGNGMCFTKRLVLTYGYPAFSVVEDVELAIFLLRKGVGVRFVPGAQVFGQMTTSAHAASVQRARWEGGRWALIRRLSGPLLREGFRTRDAAMLDAAVDLLVPPFTILTGISGLAAISGLLLAALHTAPLTVGVASGLAAVLAVEMVYVWVALALVRAPAKIYGRLIFAPLFVVWKLGVYLRLAMGRGGAAVWTRTERQRLS